MLRKCQYCNGRGYTFDGREYKDTRQGFTMINKKEQCKKCYGKGMR